MAESHRTSLRVWRAADPDPDARIEVPAMTSKFRYRDSILIRTGALLFLVGPGFLMAAWAISRLMGDMQPNPIGPGLLAFVLFWPSVILLTTGTLWTFLENRKT